METINIEVEINKKIDVDIHISEIIQTINDLPMKKRWNYIAQIMNGVRLNISDLTEEQREIIKNYLNEKLKLL